MNGNDKEELRLRNQKQNDRIVFLEKAVKELLEREQLIIQALEKLTINQKTIGRYLGVNTNE